MKKLLFCLMIALAAFSVSSFAQRGGGGARMRQVYIDSLQFTPVQADSVIAVNQDFGQQRRAIFQDQSLSPEDRKAQMDAINAQINARYKGFLTDDQIAKLAALQQRMRANMMRNRGGGGNNR